MTEDELEVVVARAQRIALRPIHLALLDIHNVVAEVRRLRAALVIYADEANWMASREDVPTVADCWGRGEPEHGWTVARETLGQQE